MSDSRKTPFVWGTGVAVFLLAYLASPPVLAMALQGREPAPPYNTIILAAYAPLQLLYDNSPWYRKYVDFTCQLVTP